MSNPAHSDEFESVPYQVLDLTTLITAGFIPGFYYSVGDNDEVEESGTVAIVLEGPYATLEAGIKAARDFITQAIAEPGVNPE